jgi:DNA recombination protein RmuC
MGDFFLLWVINSRKGNLLVMQKPTEKDFLEASMFEFEIVIVLNLFILALLMLLLFRFKNKDSHELILQLTMIEKGLERLEKTVKEEGVYDREESALRSRDLRQEVMVSLNQLQESVMNRLTENSNQQSTQLDVFSQQLHRILQSNEQRLTSLRETLEGQLKVLRDENGSKLEEMRLTVDEKLHATLEKRLGESFQLVSERLELVHKGLGEMQTLAAGVGDLKRVLTNVKTRGIWGEIQLGNLLEQILTPEQYEKNIATRPGSSERVEYAIKLPGKDLGNVVYLPIDAKFPQEDYQRLLDAQDQANPVLAEESAKAIETRIKAEAKDIATKYIAVPHTTEFALLFLPIEGLYAEVLRRPGLSERLMREYKIIVTGPTTLAALLNSLQLGFQTLAIEKRSSEVWSLLGAVKSEFGKFGDLLDKTRKKLDEASQSIDLASRKSRTIERRLRTVQDIPCEEVKRLEAGIPLDEEEPLSAIESEPATYGS